jgi:hypothetical protein
VPALAVLLQLHMLLPPQRALLLLPPPLLAVGVVAVAALVAANWRPPTAVRNWAPPTAQPTAPAARTSTPPTPAVVVVAAAAASVRLVASLDSSGRDGDPSVQVVHTCQCDTPAVNSSDLRRSDRKSESETERQRETETRFRTAHMP